MPQALTTRLQIKHLRLIAAIADLGQLSLAAERLGISQPAASRALAEIEAMVGAPAFERHPKGLAPTALGEALLRHARNVLDELSEAALEVEKLALGGGGLVRIGAVTGAAVSAAVPAVRRLKELAPEVELHIDVATSEELVNGLKEMRYDMVLGRLPPDATPGDFALMPGAEERLQILASRRHPLAGRRLSLAELSGTAWVIQGPGAPIRQALEQALVAQGAPVPGNVINTGSLLVTLALLAEAEVVAPMAREVARLLTATQPSLTALRLDAAITVSPYALITLRGRRLSPAAMRCRGLLSDMLRVARGPS
jgi:DNA-binding transcriptional LysR family regulator